MLSEVTLVKAERPCFLKTVLTKERLAASVLLGGSTTRARALLPL